MVEDAGSAAGDTPVGPKKGIDLGITIESARFKVGPFTISVKSPEEEAREGQELGQVTGLLSCLITKGAELIQQASQRPAAEVTHATCLKCQTDHTCLTRAELLDWLAQHKGHDTKLA
jgi:hypothetical protein